MAHHALQSPMLSRQQLIECVTLQVELAEQSGDHAIAQVMCQVATLLRLDGDR
jgi:hypothetical protein